MDDEPINFDVKKIKVTLSCKLESFDSINKPRKIDIPKTNSNRKNTNVMTAAKSVGPNMNPVVRLKKLTNEEKARILGESTRKNVVNETKIAPSVFTEYKSTDTFTYMTRHKRQQLAKKTAPSTSVTNVTEKVIAKNKSISKRKNVVDSSQLNNSKKRKISTEGLTITEYIEPKTCDEPVQAKPTTVAIPRFKINEVIWCKLKGHNCWPGKITSIENRKYEVFWFNDYRKSKVFQTQIFDFHSNYKKFSEKAASLIGLETAIKEAIIYSVSKISKS